MLCNSLTRDESNALYLQTLEADDEEAIRRLCTEDLFFLLTVGCNRRDVNRDFLYDRCREVERAPNGMLDLWAREHYKSTIITYGLTIQDILKNPEVTACIYSHSKSIARGFLTQIKRELTDNEFLKKLFPDVLYANPEREAPAWSLEAGIIVKRQSNPNAPTLMASGLVDGQPISKHFSVLIYDDVVTRDSVNTPEQIMKTTECLALSFNTGTREGVRRFIGTKYHHNDTYRSIIERSTATPRLYPATTTGKVDGSPTFLTQKELDKKREDMGSFVFACQMLLDPLEDSVMGFKEEWLRFYGELGQTDTGQWNHYILVDPAGEQKKTNDYTVMVVIALAPDHNYYLVDAIRDRLNLTERAQVLFDLVLRHRSLNVGYEKYGLQADIEHIKYEMEHRNFRFNLTPIGGATSKDDRIRRMVPIFENGRFWVPNRLLFVDREKKIKDFMKEFLQEEYLSFPVCSHKDMLDAISRIVEPDLNAQFPSIQEDLTGTSMTIKRTSTERAKTEYTMFS